MRLNPPEVVNTFVLFILFLLWGGGIKVIKVFFLLRLRNIEQLGRCVHKDETCFRHVFTPAFLLQNDQQLQDYKTTRTKKTALATAHAAYKLNWKVGVQKKRKREKEGRGDCTVEGYMCFFFVNKGGFVVIYNH